MRVVPRVLNRNAALSHGGRVLMVVLIDDVRRRALLDVEAARASDGQIAPRSGGDFARGLGRGRGP